MSAAGNIAWSLASTVNTNSNLRIPVTFGHHFSVVFKKMIFNKTCFMTLTSTKMRSIVASFTGLLFAANFLRTAVAIDKVALRGTLHVEEEHDHRKLMPSIRAQHIFSLHDPRTVQQKNFQIPKGILESDKTWQTALSFDEVPRPLSILSFGTSQTYGHGLTDRRYAYPYLISPDATLVDNLAVPATAADQPSLCLQSMIPDADTKNYDLITFEFPSNQSDGVRLLVKRLRERYPKAVIMFVHVWHFVGRARFKGYTPAQKNFDPDLRWTWRDEGDTFSATDNTNMDCVREICQLHEMMEILKEVNGVAYMMDPKPSPQEVLTQGWFAEDWHHLTQEGHKNVAIGIAEMLKKDQKLWNQAFMDGKPLGSWSLGDQCYNWYFSGKINVSYTGAKFVCEENTNMDCSLEMDPRQGGSISFKSDFDRPVPVAIGYLTKGFPDVFPTVMVTLNGVEPALKVNPDLDRSTRVNPKSQTLVTSYIQIGYAEPGVNRVTISPTELKPRPFSVIGIYLCGACKEFQNGHMGIGALNIDNNGNGQHFDKVKVKALMKYPGH